MNVCLFFFYNFPVIPVPSKNWCWKLPLVLHVENMIDPDCSRALQTNKLLNIINK